METARLLNQFWPCALATAFYVKNRSPQSAHSCTPFEMFLGTKPSLDTMQSFGCRGFVFDEGRNKLDSKAQKGTVLGYSSRSNCYIVCTDDATALKGPSKM